MCFATSLALHLFDVKHVEDEKYKAKTVISEDEVMDIIPAYPKEKDGPIIKGKKISLSLEENMYKKLPGWLWVKVFRAIIGKYNAHLLDAYNAAIEASIKAKACEETDGEGEEISPDDPDFC